MLESYENMTVLELRRVAKERGVKLGAGISKQGIIEKLNNAEAAAPSEEPPVAEAPNIPSSDDTAAVRHPIRSAAIITDDEPEENDEDDIPVLTPNPALQTPVISREAARPAPSAAPAPASPASSLASISSKAPAFTMEGSRAWHNPRAYQPQGTSFPTRSSWAAPDAARPSVPDARPAPAAYAPRTPQTGAPARFTRTQAPAPVYQAPAAPSRFGPEGTPDMPQDYRASERPAADYSADYRPQTPPAAYRADYAPRAPEYASVSSPDYTRRDALMALGRDLGTSNPAVPEMLATGECGDGAGVLELHPDGYGFLRADNFLPGKNDVYVSNAQIRRFNLRSGDYIAGKTRPQRENDRYCAMLYITEINGHPAEEVPQRASFDTLTAIYPKKRLTLSSKTESDPLLRAIDLLSPIGFGQRAMVVAPPRSGRTTLMKKLAAAVSANYPNAFLMLLLIDERPEDVTELKESVKGDVLYSTFDAPPENHVRVSELTLERAMRLVEQKKDVVLLVDSLSKLCRAYNTLAPQTSRILPGGLAAGILTRAKRFFGAARNTKEAGSLTIIATMQVENGSRVDDSILDEFRGTSNMELVLERVAGAKKMLPCVNFMVSSTRHNELLLTDEEQQLAELVRAELKKSAEKAALRIADLMSMPADELAEKLAGETPEAE